MAKKSDAEKLADLIEANPNCTFFIDNDSWDMYKNEMQKSLADSYKYSWATDWYSNSNNYGAGIAEALVILLNRRGFNIKAEAV
jgi:uncharacterized membrane protein YkgB